MPDPTLDELAVETAALAAKIGQAAASLGRPGSRTATAKDHIRSALQVISNLLDLGALDLSDRRQAEACLDLLWRALREIEKNNV